MLITDRLKDFAKAISSKYVDYISLIGDNISLIDYMLGKLNDLFSKRVSYMEFDEVSERLANRIGGMDVYVTKTIVIFEVGNTYYIDIINPRIKVDVRHLRKENDNVCMIVFEPSYKVPGIVIEPHMYKSNEEWKMYNALPLWYPLLQLIKCTNVGKIVEEVVKDTNVYDFIKPVMDVEFKPIDTYTKLFTTSFPSVAKKSLTEDEFKLLKEAFEVVGAEIIRTLGAERTIHMCMKDFDKYVVIDVPASVWWSAYGAQIYYMNGIFDEPIYLAKALDYFISGLVYYVLVINKLYNELVTG